MTMRLRCHHVGKVVASIADEYSEYKELGFCIPKDFSHPVEDPHQRVRVGVVELPPLRIELLEPLDTNSPITAYQRRGGGFHHICYAAEQLDDAIVYMRDNLHSKQLTPITQSVWQGRPVVFFLFHRSNIIEFIGPKH